jgi:hypothetical protein
MQSIGIETLFDIEQGSEQWRAIRCGLPTASEFSSILAKGEGKTRRSYMLRLAGEILTGVPADGFETADTVRGHEMEPAARTLYAFMTDTEPHLVGFVRNGRKGCSPDAMIGNDGLLEIKTKKPALLIDVLLKGEFPPEHKAQCQGALWVTEREWIDLAVYWPGLPLFIIRATRDEPYINTLSNAVSAFNEELDSVVASIRSYRDFRSAAQAA